MKPIFLTLFVAFFFCIFFSSCEKTFNTVVDFDIPHTPMIALECLFITDSTFASISSTVSITGKDRPISINNANAWLYENNILKDSFRLNYDLGYVCPFTNYKAGNTYKIIANAPTFKPIEAEDMSPYPIDIIKTEFTKNAKQIAVEAYGNTPQSFDEFRITFRNDATIKDYYQINVYTTGSGGQNSFIVSTDIDIDPNDNEDPLGTSNNVVYPPFTLGDANFNGNEKTLVFYALSANTDQINSFWNIYISHLSESYYKYTKTKELYERNQRNPFAEPVQIFSNVKNGIGIYALKKDTILVY